MIQPIQLVISFAVFTLCSCFPTSDSTSEVVKAATSALTNVGQVSTDWPLDVTPKGPTFEDSVLVKGQSVQKDFVNNSPESTKILADVSTKETLTTPKADLNSAIKTVKINLVDDIVNLLKFVVDHLEAFERFLNRIEFHLDNLDKYAENSEVHYSKFEDYYKALEDHLDKLDNRFVRLQGIE